MKIGLITDIHNNLVALNRVLDEFEKMECEAIICSGDIIGIGPFPEETVQRMIGLKNLIVAVQGNHEHYLTKSMKDSSMSDEERKDRKSVVYGKSVPPCVDIGLRRIMKTKK